MRVITANGKNQQWRPNHTKQKVPPHALQAPPKKNHDVPLFFELQDTESFCTVATKEFWREAVLLVFSLRQYHHEPIYVWCDKVVESKVRQFCHTKDVHFIHGADEDELSRVRSTHFEGKLIQEWPRGDGGYSHVPWACYLKHRVVEFALERHRTTFFLDADVFAVAPCKEALTSQLGCTPSWHNPRWDGVRPTYGAFNAGMLWCADPEFPAWWSEASLTRSAFMDQQCLDEAYHTFSVTILSETQNFGFWRLWGAGKNLTEEDSLATVLTTVGLSVRDTIRFKERELQTFHVHPWCDNPCHKRLQEVVRFLLENSRQKEHNEVYALMSKLDGEG